MSLNGSPEQNQSCIDAVEVFTNPSHDRCTTTADCAAAESLCVSPREDLQLLRLKVRAQALDYHETFVLWSGPPREIFEEGLLHVNFFVQEGMTMIISSSQ